MTTTKRKLPSDYLAQGWCQREYAQKKSGKSVYYDAVDACSWCLWGAMEIALWNHNIDNQESDKLGRWLFDHKYDVPWNDAPGRTQAEVVAVMLEAEAAVLNPITKEAV